MRNINIGIVAKKSNVSQTTVSRVLNNSSLVKEATAQRVRHVMSELSYQPNALARGLRIDETRTIGVIISNVLNPFYTSVVRGIEDAANKSDYSIILCNTDERPDKEKQYIQVLASKRVDGLVLASAGIEDDYGALTDGKPIVFIDRSPTGKNKGKFDAVLVQNFQGSFDAVTQLIKSGFKRIGIITGQNVSTTGYQRFCGYEKALTVAGIPIDKKLIKFGDFLGRSSYESTIELVKEVKCGAIFAANNMILLGALKAISELKLKVPDDIGLSAFDDLEWMRYCRPQITAIRQPTYEIGTTAVSLLLDRISGSQKPVKEVLLPVKLILRNSSQKN